MQQLPREDCRIELPYDAAKIVTAPPRTHEAEITALDRVADGVMRVMLTLRPAEDGSSSADFESGQFFRITVPGTDARRAYSPANVANWDGQLEFFIRLLPGGAMSDYLAERAGVGDIVTVSSADGEFVLAENGLRPRWFLAGGTGLSPLLSMLRKMAGGAIRSRPGCSSVSPGTARSSRRTRSSLSRGRCSTSTPTPWCGTRIRPGRVRWATR